MSLLFPEKNAFLQKAFQWEIMDLKLRQTIESFITQ